MILAMEMQLKKKKQNRKEGCDTHTQKNSSFDEIRTCASLIQVGGANQLNYETRKIFVGC